MAQLTIRRVDEALVRALKVRAARAGRSAEAELRHILEQVLRGPQSGRSFKAHLLAMPDDGHDEDFDGARDLPRDVEL